jgi:serine/threonine protein phosphatase PrpC
MDRSEVLPFSGGAAAVFSTACPSRNGSSPNQDAAGAFLAGDGRGVLVIADGAGGMPVGDRASAIAIRSLAKSLQVYTSNDAVDGNGNGTGGLREVILDGIEKANQDIQKLGVGAATTLAGVEVDGKTVRPYHVGDSMILVVGQRKKVKHLTMAHSPVGYAVQAGVLTPEDALHHEDLSVVSNLVGATDMRIEIGPAIELAAKDTVVVGSDGLFDNLHLEEIVEHVRTGPIDKAAEALRQACRQRMDDPKEGLPSKPDDLTFVIYRPTA